MASNAPVAIGMQCDVLNLIKIAVLIFKIFNKDPELELFERILDLYGSIYHKDQATVDKITEEADALVLTLKNVNISTIRYGVSRIFIVYLFIIACKIAK